MSTITIQPNGSAEINNQGSITYHEGYARFVTMHSLFHPISVDKWLNFASGICELYYEGNIDGNWKHDDFVLNVKLFADFLPKGVYDKNNDVTRGRRLKVDICVPSITLDAVHKGVEAPSVGWAVNDFGYTVGTYIYGEDRDDSIVQLKMQLGVKGRNSHLLKIGYTWVMEGTVYDYEIQHIPD